MTMHNKPHNTSWEQSADWYDEYLQGDDTYQTKVILPNVLRLLAVKRGDGVLDLACGQGYFSKHLHDAGAAVTGIDASESLTAKARDYVPGATFHVAPAEKLPFENAQFDAVLCVLALQNMESLQTVFKEVRRVLKKEGKFIFVVNHPAFRVPKRSDWGWDEKEKVQYRRVDRYLSSEKVKIDMHPGMDASFTWSFHRSLQDFMKALSAAGFGIARMEEWISHKKSQMGPRSVAEDNARKEIPLFLAIEVRAFS